MTRSRDEQVLAALLDIVAGSPTHVCRALNFEAVCSWCPAGPKRLVGQTPKVVPAGSRAAVRRVLLRLEKAGRVRRHGASPSLFISAGETR